MDFKIKLKIFLWNAPVINDYHSYVTDIIEAEERKWEVLEKDI